MERLGAAWIDGLAVGGLDWMAKGSWMGGYGRDWSWIGMGSWGLGWCRGKGKQVCLVVALRWWIGLLGVWSSNLPSLLLFSWCAWWASLSPVVFLPCFLGSFSAWFFLLGLVLLPFVLFSGSFLVLRCPCALVCGLLPLFFLAVPWFVFFRHALAGLTRSTLGLSFFRLVSLGFFLAVVLGLFRLSLGAPWSPSLVP